MNQPRKRLVAGRRTAPKAAAPARASEARSLWRRLGKGPKWLLVTAVPLLLAAVIPGGAPWIVDRTLDAFGQRPLDARGEAYPQIMAGQYWATDEILTDPVSYDIMALIQSRGAQMGTSGHRITLESNRAGRIDVDKVTAVVEQRRAPLAGTAFIADPQGDSEALLIEFNLDLGSEIPAQLKGESNSSERKATPYGANGKIRYVELGKPEHLLISAFTTKCYCQWRVRVDYSYRGSRGHLIVPPPSERSFVSTAWVDHKVEYNMNSAESGIPQRHDCLAGPIICRSKQ
jgi:hypothetical protein